MSTRSNIGIRENDGSVVLIYCHSDGYPAYNGMMLLKHHNSEAAARALVSFGDMSSLDKKTSPPNGVTHTFDNSVEGVSRYYGRDRGEEGVEPRTLPPAVDPIQQEYCYLWNVEAGKWEWAAAKCKFQLLTPAAWGGE